MKLSKILLVLGVLACATLGLTLDSSAGGRPMSTDLTGAEEVNASGTPGVGDPDGTGTASLTLNSGLGEICFDITVANINNN